MIDHVLVKIPWNQTCSIIFQGCSFDLMYHCVVKICNKEPSHFSMVSSMSKPLAWSLRHWILWWPPCFQTHFGDLCIPFDQRSHSLDSLFHPQHCWKHAGEVLNRPRKHRLDLTRCLHKNLPFFRVLTNPFPFELIGCITLTRCELPWESELCRCVQKLVISHGKSQP